ncbi:hypothetical protein BMS3Abin14_00234 [bacterium BMS3Abin14]|nr:hypothetical protein BMS3Abin14_00234 [bacterium BMS3Abin14]
MNRAPMGRVKDMLKIILLAAGGVALFVGISQGQWAETMFNATLL